MELGPRLATLVPQGRKSSLGFERRVAMPHADAAKPLSEPQRKEIFLALMDAQDHDMPVAQSRKAIAERFGVTESQLRLIEREGLDRNWLES